MQRFINVLARRIVQSDDAAVICPRRKLCEAMAAATSAINTYATADRTKTAQERDERAVTARERDADSGEATEVHCPEVSG